MLEKKIGDRTYRVEQPLATKALELMFRVLSVLGHSAETIAPVLTIIGNNDPDARKVANEAVIKGIGHLLTKNDPEQLTSLLNDLVGLAKIKRPSGAWDRVQLDTDFTGSLSQLFPLLTVIVDQVFGDFFGGLRGVGDRTPKA